MHLKGPLLASADAIEIINIACMVKRNLIALL